MISLGNFHSDPRHILYRHCDNRNMVIMFVPKFKHILNTHAIIVIGVAIWQLVAPSSFPFKSACAFILATVAFPMI